ncbi:hypothetical protein BH24ACT3_BH24ACT3_15700 [soil metagenome]
MKQYLLSVHHTEDEAPPAPEAMEQAFKQVDEFNEELQAAGAWVFAGGLHPPSTATVVRVQDGEVLITDGPFAETKEQLGGFWVINADDLDAALVWAGKGAAACMTPSRSARSRTRSRPDRRVPTSAPRGSAWPACSPRSCPTSRRCSGCWGWCC